MCEIEGDIVKTKNGPDETWPLLMCCQEDMCNYQEELDINIYVDTNVNGSIDKGQYPLQLNTCCLWGDNALSFL